MFKQISKYFEPVFSNFQCGFRKGFSSQQYLLPMLGKWKLAVDNQKQIRVLLMDLSKAFDFLSIDLLIAKLNANGFSIDSLRLVQEHLLNHKQRTRINLPYSSWEEILFPAIKFRTCFIQHLFM